MMIGKLRKILILLLIFTWIFSGWPSFNIRMSDVLILKVPPKIQEAQAAAPTYQAFSAIAASTGADVTVTLPAHAANDILLVGVIVRDVDDTITWPSGWTEIATVDRGTTARYWWAWKRAASSAETNPLVDKSTATGNTYAAVITYRGAARAGDPWEVKGTAQTRTTDPSVLTGISTLTADSLVVAAMPGEDNNNASIITTGTDPAAYTEHYVESTTGDDGVVTFSEAVRTTAGATGDVSVNWNTAVPVGWGGILLALVPPRVTTLGDGTDPGNSTVAPGSTTTDLDAFTLATDYSTDSITALTVTLSSGTYAGLSEVRITNSDGSTTYFSAVAPSADTVDFSGGTSIPVATSTTTFKVRITPKTHADMSAPPGAEYAVTGTVTSYTSNNDNDKTGTDTDSATITIDNASPNGATATSTSAGNQKVTLNWTTSNSSDFSRSVVLRWTGGSAGSEVPAEGTDYTIAQDIGTAAVACVRTADAASTAVTDAVDGSGGGGGCRTTALTNGQQYTYKVFQKDSNGNYDTGVDMGSATPVAPTVSCSTDISSISFSALNTSSVFTSSPNASSTMTCSGTSSGCTLYVKDNGSGSNPGLYKSASPIYLIASADATLSAGTDGYGIQATSTAAGSGGTLGFNSKYNRTGNDVGGLVLTNTLLASSTVDVANREAVTTHKAAVSSQALSGDYSDTITYECVVN